MKKLVLMFSLSCFMVAAHAAENQLTDAEKADGFQMLWDGSTSKGWKSIKSDSFPAKGWEMKDGVLSVLLNGGRRRYHYRAGLFEFCVEGRV
jgi:hypothetical protein